MKIGPFGLEASVSGGRKIAMDLTVTLCTRGGTDKGRAGDLRRCHDRSRHRRAGNENNGDDNQQTRTNTPGHILRPAPENPAKDGDAKSETRFALM